MRNCHYISWLLGVCTVNSWKMCVKLGSGFHQTNYFPREPCDQQSLGTASIGKYLWHVNKEWSQKSLKKLRVQYVINAHLYIHTYIICVNGKKTSPTVMYKSIYATTFGSMFYEHWRLHVTSIDQLCLSYCYKIYYIRTQTRFFGFNFLPSNSWCSYL